MSKITSQGSNPSKLPSEFRPKADDCPEFDPYKLDFLFSNDIVNYKCSCGQFRRLNLTYLCKYCIKIRCRTCVSHEVDSQYCQHCLEYIPTIDPKFQMNKCASCYKCPSCQHLLSQSIISTSPSPSNDEIPPENVKHSQEQIPKSDVVVKRICQLVCEFCRWSSESFIIEGSRISHSLADFEIPNLDKINSLTSYYKALSLKEKSEQERKNRRPNTRSGNTMALLKKYGIYNTLSPKLFESLRARTALSDKLSYLGKDDNLTSRRDDEVTIEAPQPSIPITSDEIKGLDIKYYYGDNYAIEEVSSIEQRFSQLEIQPDNIRNFKPISKSLSVKRLIRCKECDHILCRGEYSPGAIRFKIQSAAYYHVPELRLKSDVYPLRLKLGQENIVEFTLQNQTLSNIKVKFENDQDYNDSTYDIKLPPNELSLSPKDDTADYRYIPGNMRPLNTETQITFQSPFKVGFYIVVTPKVITDRLSIRFTMQHNVIMLLNPKEGEKEERILQNIQVIVGPVE